MKNIGKMMKQAQEMQSKMGALQKELDAYEIEGSASGGIVKVTVNGKGSLTAIKIDKSLMVADEVDILEDLIMAAFNDAKTKVDSHVSIEMNKISGGLAGLNLPF